MRGRRPERRGGRERRKEIFLVEKKTPRGVGSVPASPRSRVVNAHFARVLLNSAFDPGTADPIMQIRRYLISFLYLPSVTACTFYSSNFASA